MINDIVFHLATMCVYFCRAFVRDLNQKNLISKR
jgi:hypothetical protein